MITDEESMTRELSGYYVQSGCTAALPNFYMMDNRYEADLVILNRNNYVFELEIKMSRADFKVEFKNKPEKHAMLANRTSMVKRAGKNGQWAYESTHMPNRYYLACPPGLLDLEEIPEYAGLIEVTHTGYIKVIKKAPQLHTNKCDQELMIRMLKSITTRYWKCR